MQLKKIKRAEKKGTESVMDEKFSLLFSSQFSVGGGELVFQVNILCMYTILIYMQWISYYFCKLYLWEGR